MGRRFKIIGLLLLCVWALAGTGLENISDVFGKSVKAQPSVSSVSGSIADGQTVTISGTEFGNHPDYGGIVGEGLNLIFDRFDDYDSIDGGGSKVTDIYYIHPDAIGNFLLDSNGGNNRIGSGKNIENFAGRSTNYLRRSDHQGYDMVFWSFFFKIPSDYPDIVGPNQWKIHRIYSGSGDWYLGIDQLNSFGVHGDGAPGTTTHRFINPISGTYQGEPFKGTWHKIDIELDISSSIANVWMDGHLYHTSNDDFAGWAGTFDDYRWMVIGAFMNGNMHSGWFDDLYTSRTFARVEISPTNNFQVNSNTRLIKETQIPVAWSDGSITVTVNQGSFTEGSTVYLFVVDENGEISNGYPITVGETPICTDFDTDTYYLEAGCGTPVDCNDTNPDINPGATEICDNGVDEDCDGDTDCLDNDCFSDPSCQTGTTISVDSTYSGYSTLPIDDEIIEPYGGTATTWASGQSSQHHWVTIDFSQPQEISNVTIYWAFNDYRQRFMSSQEVWVQYWDGFEYANASMITNTGEVKASTSTFATITTSSLRLWQPPNMGYINYSTVMWLTEVDYSKQYHSADTNQDGCILENELVAFIGLWHQNSTAYPMWEMMEGIGLWKVGGC